MGKSEERVANLTQEEKEIWLAGFKAGLDAKSCCCSGCSRHSIALEEKITGDLMGEFDGKEG